MQAHAACSHWAAHTSCSLTGQSALPRVQVVACMFSLSRNGKLQAQVKNSNISAALPLLRKCANTEQNPEEHKQQLVGRGHADDAARSSGFVGGGCGFHALPFAQSMLRAAEPHHRAASNACFHEDPEPVRLDTAPVASADAHRRGQPRRCFYISCQRMRTAQSAALHCNSNHQGTVGLRTARS